MPVVRTDGRSLDRSLDRSLARCTVTWLPNFLGWVDYHISLAMGLRPRALRARVELRYQLQKWKSGFCSTQNSNKEALHVHVQNRFAFILSQHWKENLKGGCSGLNLSVVLKDPKTGKTGSKATMTGCAPSICGRTANRGKCYSLPHYWYWLHLPAEETPGKSSLQNLNYMEASIMIATTSMCTTVLRIACAQDEP